jgi:hypothetical protein
MASVMGVGCWLLMLPTSDLSDVYAGTIAGDMADRSEFGKCAQWPGMRGRSLGGSGRTTNLGGRYDWPDQQIRQRRGQLHCTQACLACFQVSRTE